MAQDTSSSRTRMPAGRSAPGGVTDRQRLHRVRRLSNLLDTAFGIPGTPWNFGLDSLVGLIPGIGDLTMAGVAVYMIYEARQLGASRGTLIRMAINTGVDFLVGTVPIAGDLFDFAFKSNRRNLRLLERHLDRERE